jgi:arylsulfatase A-like enzyme
VLFVVIDTLRSDRLGTYGYERDTSPTIDEVASKGVRFARQLSQSTWTKASMASLWTGLYPTGTGVTRYNHIVPDEAVMPAEQLREAGFRTIGLYRNGWVSPTFGFEQGFDVYTRPPRSRINPRVRARNPTISTAGTDEDTVQAGIEFLRVSGHDERWFLYLHLMDVHEYLYDEESAIFGGTHSDQYDASIRWTDGTVGLLLEYLADFGLSDKTLVVITSDHGEAFRERGLEGHARAVYKETTEVPLVMAFPFRLEPGLVIPTRTLNVDIWPTIYDLIGLDPEEIGKGMSRVPEILAAVSGEALSTSDTTTGFSFLDETWGGQKPEPRIRVAVTEGPYRYIRSPGLQTDAESIEELFNADEDPMELSDIAESEPELVERLRAIAEAELEEPPYWGEAPTRELDELELNQLRALGYAIP